MPLNPSFKLTVTFFDHTDENKQSVALEWKDLVEPGKEDEIPTVVKIGLLEMARQELIRATQPNNDKTEDEVLWEEA